MKMEGFCRGCLIKYDDPMELLQYTEKNRRLFVYSTGLQVKRNDRLIFQLCKDCFLNMKQACKFKKQCRSSDKRFKNYLGLKDIGDPIDFCTFLKNCEDALTFRLPLMSGSSTPATQKYKDDDNESTCTSIRNFMTDILQGEEVPDSEAKIIREVIEEEADVLDDSLDSHWLQDDMSIDTDFRLDFSFSPFSTPRSVNNDHNYTPKRYVDEKEIKYNTKTIESRNEIINDITDVINKNRAEKEFCNYDEDINDVDEFESIDNNIETLEHNIECLTVNIDEITHTNDFEIPNEKGKEINVNVQNFYIPQDVIEDNIVQDTSIITSNILENFGKEKSCSIDRNLEEALKDVNNKEFSLDNLLVSPPVYQGVSAPATPIINNILFGDKLDLAESDSNHKIGQCIENYQDVKGDIELFEEFFESNSKDIEPVDYDEHSTNIKSDKIKIENEDISMDGNENNFDIAKPQVEDNISFPLFGNENNIVDAKPKIEETIEEYDLDNCVCNMCKKKFKNVKALSIHFTKIHQRKIIKIIKIPHAYREQPRVCNICGKSYNFRSSFSRHMKIHKNSKEGNKIKCNICLMEFKNQSYLDMHMKSHIGPSNDRKIGKYLCTICGAASTSSSNNTIHMRRHTNNYTDICTVCEKGFHRSAELKAHMRMFHTGETPYHCHFCPNKYIQRGNLLRHIKSVHLGEKHFECHHCGSKFVGKNNLRAHLKHSKKCLMIFDDLQKRKKLKREPKPLIAEVQETPKIVLEDIIVYTPPDKTIVSEIMNQLPIIDTELSN